MVIAVVSGPAERLHSLAVALRNQGFEAVVFNDTERTEDVPAGGGPPDPSPTPSSLVDIGPDLCFSDWRTEVLNLTSGNGATYFGWAGADRRWCTAVLRGAVLSPLRSSDSTTDAPAGSPEALSVVFARTVLADAAGVSARCSRCGGPGCGACHASGLAPWAREFVDDFVEELLPTFPPEYIQVPAAEVTSWLRRRTGGLVAQEPRDVGDSIAVAPLTGAVPASPAADVSSRMDDPAGSRFPWRGRPEMHKTT